MVPDIAILKRKQQDNLPNISSATPSPSSLDSTPSPESRPSSVSSNASSNSPRINSDYNSNNSNTYSNGTINGNYYPSSSLSSSSHPLVNPDILPIHYVKNQLLARINQNESLIIIGETGSGKTTQIPQFIYEFFASKQYQSLSDSHNLSGVIGITQPRRVAALSLANRVASETGTQLGELVGYKIRFEDNTTPRTRIKYMTDGILLREAIADPLLSKYRVIILDEAHERTVQIDILFGVVKKAQRLRNSKRALVCNERNSDLDYKHPPLKLIVMSATMDVDHFSRYFDNAPVYYIEGRTYPIEKFYTEEKQSDYVTAALTTVFQIHQTEDELLDEKNNEPIGGDILVFCTGQEEIESMVKVVNDLAPQLKQTTTSKGVVKTLKACPLYAALPTSKQQQIFDRSAKDCFRRVIFATNIAETSITIPNIRFVIDTGKAKSRIFSAKSGFEIMQVEDISKAQACQRSGRAGRLAPGQCYRLYTRKDYRSMKAFPVPDIQKCNLASILLQIIALGVEDVMDFDFIDSPSKENIESSLAQLTKLKAIVGVNNSAALYRLTDTGRLMVTFPVDPRFSALIIASQAYRCTEEILIIIAMLSIENIFYVPSGERETALTMHQKFASSEGDLIKLLNVFRRYREARQSAAWCKENYLRPIQLKMSVEIRNQLIELCKRASISIVSCSNTEVIRKCLAVGTGIGAGLGANVAILQRDGDYRTVQFAKSQPSTSTEWSLTPSKTVYIHPSSCLFSPNNKPECVLFVELVHTSKSYMRNLCLIDQQWLLEPNQVTDNPLHTIV